MSRKKGKKKKRPGKCKEEGCARRREYDKSYCGKHHMARWRANNILQATFSTLKMNAKRRGKDFDITLDQFKAKINKTGYLDKKGRTNGALQIDRKENEKGYTVDNINVITKKENVEKYYNVDKLKEAVIIPDFEKDPF